MRTALRLPPSLSDDASSERDALDEEPDERAGETNDGYIHDDYLSDDERLRLEAMQGIANGDTRAHWAPILKLTPERVGQLYQDHLDHGRDALVRYGTRDLHGSNLHPEIKRLARSKLKGVPTMTARDLADDANMAAVCDLILGAQPSVRRFKTLIDDLAVTDPAIGRPPTSRGRATDAQAAGYTAFWNRPGYIEYDEETTNLAAQLVPGLPFTRRSHALHGRDIASKVPVGHVVSTQHMDQNDLRLLYLRILRPKDHLVARARTKNPWPIAILPFGVLGDNAWINYATMFLLTLPEMGVLVEFAPAKRPERKAVVESGIGQVQKIHEDRQPNSTKRDPRLRGNAEPEKFAAAHGITGRDIEDDFTRILVDAVAWGWDKRARVRPMRKWEALVERFGVRTYEGDPGDLVRRFKRPLKPKKVGQHGVTLGVYDYVARWGGDRDLDPRNELPYPSPRAGFMPRGSTVVPWVDDDDVRMIDVRNLAGQSLGTAVCNVLGAEYGRPVSRFELEVRTELERDEKARGTESRDEATTAVRQTNQHLSSKVVAKKLAHVDHIVKRQAENSGLTVKPASRTRKPKAAAPPAGRDPLAMPTFTKRDGSYREPVVRLRAVPSPSGTTGVDPLDSRETLA
jgi:hypothetical protein